MKVTIYLHADGPFGAYLKREVHREKEVLRIEGDVAVLADEFAESGEARFSLVSGRRLVGKNDGSQPAWDFWRLDLETVPKEVRGAR